VGKAGWRAAADARLRALTPVQRRAHAAILAREIKQLAQTRGARRVGLYAPVGAEVDTRELANALLSAGISLAYPRLRPDGQAMDFADCAGPAALAPRPRSRLLEPTGEVVPPAELDLLVVPAVAVRGDLTRLGRGGGHYDRYLPQLRDDTLLVGAVPEACVLDWTPVEPHDRRLHLVCTERGLAGPAA
jgi:5-formyltetrahydrofolate cyclo-ligase